MPNAALRTSCGLSHLTLTKTQGVGITVVLMLKIRNWYQERLTKLPNVTGEGGRNSQAHSLGSGTRVLHPNKDWGKESEFSPGTHFNPNELGVEDCCASLQSLLV